MAGFVDSVVSFSGNNLSEKCKDFLQAMEVLARTSGAEFDTTHPAIPKRIEALKALTIKYPPQTLF
ncbi:hypothetical protein [Fischerella sp. PCC 9605]|uniref:hypothetical protein n=1 Tax=Fischerella sp. PCC 9605 TaxID=1173024 RepID=UPI00047E6853|nr:hypothetical protein [Fischerella sp. PCC 9605]